MRFNQIANLSTGKMLSGLETRDSSHAIYHFTIKGSLTDVEPGDVLDYNNNVLLALRPHPHLRRGLYNLEAVKLSRKATISRYSGSSTGFGRGQELAEVGTGIPCHIKSLSEGNYELLLPPSDIQIGDRVELDSGSLFLVTSLINVEEGFWVNAVPDKR